MPFSKKYLLPLFTLLYMMSCDHQPVVKNSLEIELDKFVEGTSKAEIQNKEYADFIIDWKNAIQWESNCSYYYVIPQNDTFEYYYYLDFCYDKFRWVEKTHSLGYLR